MFSLETFTNVVYTERAIHLYRKLKILNGPFPGAGHIKMHVVQGEGEASLQKSLSMNEV